MVTLVPHSAYGRPRAMPAALPGEIQPLDPPGIGFTFSANAPRPF
jgi:hypothetical protein